MIEIIRIQTPYHTVGNLLHSLNSPKLSNVFNVFFSRYLSSFGFFFFYNYVNSTVIKNFNFLNYMCVHNFFKKLEKLPFISFFSTKIKKKKNYDWFVGRRAFDFDYTLIYKNFHISQFLWFKLINLSYENQVSSFVLFKRKYFFFKKYDDVNNIFLNKIHFMLKNLKEDDIIDPLFDDFNTKQWVDRNDFDYDDLLDEIFCEEFSKNDSRFEFFKNIKKNLNEKEDNFNPFNVGGNEGRIKINYSDDEFSDFESTDLNSLDKNVKDKKKQTTVDNDLISHKATSLISLHKYKHLIRKNRFLFFKFIRTKIKRQYRLTKYIHRFLNKSAWKLIKQFQMCIEHILMETRFALTPYHVKWLLECGCVFVNGRMCSNPYHVLKVGDFIQILSDNKNLEILKFFLWRKHRYKEIGYRVWRYIRFRNDFRKTAPNKVTDWIKNLSAVITPTPKNIEIDWLTQTAIILHDPLELNFSHFYMLQYISPYLLRGYNWKYIT